MIVCKDFAFFFFCAADKKPQNFLFIINTPLVIYVVQKSCEKKKKEKTKYDFYKVVIFQ